jgi:hypothetical protein
MEFIKKHYEKILLCMVLLGLVGALVMMWFIIEADKEKSEQIRENFLGGTVKPLPELDFTRQTNLVERLKSPLDLDFSTTNKLFNPLQWQKRADGIIVPVKPGQIGPEVAVVTKIMPLYFVLTLDSVETNAPDPRYVIGVEHQAAAFPAARRKQQRYASVNEKKDSFTITGVAGAPENPDQLTLKLADTGEMVVVSKDKPFQRVDGYSADLKYDPENQKWQGRRVGADLKFAGDDYNIVAIHENEVILSAQSNQKRTTLRYAP